MNIPLKPEAASEHAAAYDLLFNAITLLAVFFTVVVAILVAVLAIRYRRGTNVDRRNPLESHLGLELSWTILPLLLGLGIFAWSAYNFVQVRTPPDAEDTVEIFVIGKQWMWHLQHMNGIRENNELHVPVGRPIKMTMISQDVIHAMYLPEMRAQFHVVPGRYTELYFTPTKTGKFKMLCNMHCGTQHSEMVGYLYVLSEHDFAAWLESGGNRFQPEPLTMAERGRQIYEDLACMTCHGIGDTDLGPTLYGLYGREVQLEGGMSVTADRAYIRESILQPYEKLTLGYPDKTMPAYDLSEEQILALVEYIKTLGFAPSEDGERVPIQPYGPAARPGPTSPTSAVEIANEAGSAGYSQAEQLRDRR